MRGIPVVFQYIYYIVLCISFRHFLLFFSFFFLTKTHTLTSIFTRIMNVNRARHILENKAQSQVR